MQESSLVLGADLAGAPARDGRLLVVSPHLDDAILSCGGLLHDRPGSVVLTVYTGLPQQVDVLTEWDRSCGFHSAAEAMAQRLSENRQALSQIDCTGWELDQVDCQYSTTPDEETSAMTERLFNAIASIEPASVAIPMGLFHGDHVRVSDAALMIRHAAPHAAWFAYEDIPYRSIPAVLQARLVQLHARGIVLTPHPYGIDAAAKARLIAAYPSQLKGLNASAERLAVGECYWRLGGME